MNEFFPKLVKRGFCKNIFPNAFFPQTIGGRGKVRYHVDSSNDLSYNGRFAYDGLPNSCFVYCQFT